MSQQYIIVSFCSRRRAMGATATKQSWNGTSSSNSTKQNTFDGGETTLLSTPTKTLSKSQQSELNSYLSRRRNTTGSISMNKIVDLKNTSSGNTLKLATAATGFNHSNNKISTESKHLLFLRNKIFI
jgi:hypothetical protein